MSLPKCIAMLPYEIRKIWMQQIQIPCFFFAKLFVFNFFHALCVLFRLLRFMGNLYQKVATRDLEPCLCHGPIACHSSSWHSMSWIMNYWIYWVENAVVLWLGRYWYRKYSVRFSWIWDTQSRIGEDLACLVGDWDTGMSPLKGALAV